MAELRGAAAPVGEARPGWKVLRVLGNLLNLAGFEYQSSEEVRDELQRALRRSVVPAGCLGTHARERRRRSRLRSLVDMPHVPGAMRWCGARRRCSAPAKAARRAVIY